MASVDLGCHPLARTGAMHASVDSQNFLCQNGTFTAQAYPQPEVANSQMARLFMASLWQGGCPGRPPRTEVGSSWEQGQTHQALPPTAAQTG